MTLHIHYNHQCSACGAHYLPYEAKLPCPQCSQPAEMFFDFIERAAVSMEFNLANYRSFTSPAWFSGSLGDHVLWILFHLFDARCGYEPFAEFAADYLWKLEWGDQIYLRYHIYGIALRLYPRLYGWRADPFKPVVVD